MPRSRRYGNQSPARRESIHCWGVERRMWRRLVVDCQKKRITVSKKLNDMLREAGYGKASGAGDVLNHPE